MGDRTTQQGYSQVDKVRQQFTGYERDNETGLDFAQARYFSSTQGRFTAVDPLQASARATAPQTWNRYAYAANNPLRFTDPTGLSAQKAGGESLLSPDDRSECFGGRALRCGQEQQEQQQQQQPQQPASGDRGSSPEPQVPVLPLQGIDNDLAFIFGDYGAIARGASVDSQTGRVPHFSAPDGTLHTIHLYGDESGNKVSGVYLPEGFTNAVYEDYLNAGEPENRVIATHSETKQVLVLTHVAISSQAELNRNLSSGRTNAAGSSYVGTIAGPGGAGTGYNHSHVTLYSSREGRNSIRSQQSNPGYIINYSGYSSLTTLIKPR